MHHWLLSLECILEIEAVWEGELKQADKQINQRPSNDPWTGVFWPTGVH